MENSKIKIVFLGSGDFGETILKELIKKKYAPVWIDDFNKIKDKNPDLVIVASYGRIIPEEVLKIPKYGCLNIHASLLPKYRGSSPVQTAILNGDSKTGITIILMDKKMDHGPIVASSEFQITDPKITYKELLKELADLGAKLLVETIPKWTKGEIKPLVQNESKASYVKILKRQDGEIDWSKPPEEIERKIRAFYPWPGAFTFIRKKNKTLRIKIMKAELSKEKKLIIKKLQPEGKKLMSAEEFQRGYPNSNLPF